AGLDAVEIIPAEIVVLVEYADLGVRILLENVLAVDTALDEVVGVEAQRPREVFRIGEFCGAGGGEQLRDLLRVEVLLDRRVGGGADDLEGKQHLVTLD